MTFQYNSYDSYAFVTAMDKQYQLHRNVSINENACCSILFSVTKLWLSSHSVRKQEFGFLFLLFFLFL
jgi:hypothetical protein